MFGAAGRGGGRVGGGGAAAAAAVAPVANYAEGGVTLESCSAPAMLARIRELHAANVATLAAIASKDFVVARTYVLQWNAPAGPLEVVENVERVPVSSILRGWSDAPRLATPTDMFHDRMDYSIATFPDLERVNTAMLAVVNKYRMFGDTAEAREEVAHFVGNFDAIRAALGAILASLADSPSKASAATHELAAVNTAIATVAGKLGVARAPVLSIDDSRAPRTVDTLAGHTNVVYSTVQHKKGSVISCSADGTVRVWDLATKAVTSSFTGVPNVQYRMVMLQDGRVATASSTTANICLWNTTTGACVATLAGHAAVVQDLCVLPNGWLASCSSDGTVRVWNPETAAQVTTFAPGGGVSRLALLPGGRLAVWATNVTVWDIPDAGTPELQATLPLAIYGAISYMVSLPDSRLCVALSSGNVLLWSVRRGGAVLLATLSGHSAGITAAVVMPGNRLATASSDNTIRIWDVSPGGIGAACLSVIRDVKCAVQALYVLPADGRLVAACADHIIRIIGC